MTYHSERLSTGNLTQLLEMDHLYLIYWLRLVIFPINVGLPVGKSYKIPWATTMFLWFSYGKPLRSAHRSRPPKQRGKVPGAERWRPPRHPERPGAQRPTQRNMRKRETIWTSQLTIIQWELQDPKIEVLYITVPYFTPYFVGILW